MSLTEVIALAVSAIAVGVAFWQGFLAKSQLDQAKMTKTETEKLLDDMKVKVLRIETISDETRKDVKEQVAKLIDRQDENFKVLLNAPKETSQNEMIARMLPGILQNPEVLKNLMDLVKGTKPKE